MQSPGRGTAQDTDNMCANQRGWQRLDMELGQYFLCLFELAEGRAREPGFVAIQRLFPSQMVSSYFNKGQNVGCPHHRYRRGHQYPPTASDPTACPPDPGHSLEVVDAGYTFAP
jgi:hypothetical protein